MKSKCLVLVVCVFAVIGCGDAEEEIEIDEEEIDLVETDVQNWEKLTLVNTYTGDYSIERVLLSRYDPLLLIVGRWSEATILEIPTLATVMEMEAESGYLDICFMPNEQLLVGKGKNGSEQGRPDRPVSLDIVKIPTGEIVQELGDLQFFLDNTVTYDNNTVLLGYYTRIAIQEGGFENFVEDLTVINMDGERLMYHGGDVWLEFRVSHGDRYYMSHVNGSEIRVWETPNILIQIIEKYGEYDIDHYDISPDGKYIAIMDDDADMVRLLDTETLQEVFKHPLDLGRGDLSFNPDGKLLAVAGDYMLKILSVPGGNTVSIIDYLDLLEKEIYSGPGGIDVAFSFDGRYLILNFSDKHIIVLEPE